MKQKKLLTPNKGVRALSNYAKKDHEFCIMDQESDKSSYRTECPDKYSCINSSYMLVCIQTRDCGLNTNLGTQAINIYCKAMEEKQ